MNDWFESSIQALEQALEQAADTAATLLEQQLVQVAEKVEDVADKTVDAAYGTMEQLSDRISEALPAQTLEQLERQLDQLEDSMETVGMQTLSFLEDTFRPVGQTINPVVNDHKTCVGCRYYEGSEFGGNMLVCGIHPYGCTSDSCPDYEAVWSEKK